MSKDWMDKLFESKGNALQDATEKRQQEIVRWNRLVALSKPIWSDIKKRLVKRVEGFNLRVPKDGQVEIIQGTSEFSLQLQHKQGRHSFLISMTPVAGTISYGLASSRSEEGYLSLKIDENSNYTIEDTSTHKPVLLDDIDEVILKEYLGSLI